MGAAAETASSASSASMAPALPLGAQFWRGVREPGRAARQVLGQVEGGERRARVAQRHELAPAGLARARPPSFARGAAQKELAGEKGHGDRPAEGSSPARRRRTEGERLGVGAQRDHRFGGRGRGDRGRPAGARRPSARAAASSAAFCRVERRLQVGGDGGEALGAERVAGTCSASRKAA